MAGRRTQKPPPPLRRPGGGADSRPRLHGDGDGTQGVLAAVDGEAVGFACYVLLRDNRLDSCGTKDALIAAVRAGTACVHIFLFQPEGLAEKYLQYRTKYGKIEIMIFQIIEKTEKMPSPQVVFS